MKRIFTLLLALVSTLAFAQNVVTDLENSNRVGVESNNHIFRTSNVHVTELSSQAEIQALIQALMVGGCVEVTNISYTGTPRATGIVIDSSGTLGLDYGVLLTTGRANNFVGPNNTENETTNNGLGGDTDLSSLSSGATYDIAMIEFDFIPQGDTIFVADFIFGSEEYPEYVNTQFNDVFGFFVSGPGITGPYSNSGVNTAIIPGSSIPIAINNINNGNTQSYPSTGPCENCQYYVENDSGVAVQYDAYTVPMHLEHPVVAGETYHFKVAIADVGDRLYDSGVLIQSHSFCGDSWLQIVQFNTIPQGGLTYEFENTSQRSDNYIWDFGDGNFSTDVNPIHTYSQPGTYQVTLTGANDCFDTTYTQEVFAIVTNTQPTEATIREFEIYNTSSNGDFMMKYNADMAERVSLRIVDMQGRVISEQDFGTTRSIRQNINLSALSQGIYVAQLLVGNQVQVKRLVR